MSEELTERLTEALAEDLTELFTGPRFTEESIDEFSKVLIIDLAPEKLTEELIDDLTERLTEGVDEFFSSS